MPTLKALWNIIHCFFAAMFNEILKVYLSDNQIDYTETEQLGKILLHPLAKCFLKFKWHQVRIVYYMFMLWQVLFSVIYTGYVYQLYRYRFDTLVELCLYLGNNHASSHLKTEQFFI